MEEATKSWDEYQKFLKRVDELERTLIGRRVPGTTPIYDYDPDER